MTLTNNVALRRLLSKGNQQLCEKATGLQRLMAENDMSYQLASTWTPAVAIIFLQGSQANLPPAMLLHIASFLTGFSVKDTTSFFNRHVTAAPAHHYKMGKHTLFAREATLLTDKPVSELWITKQALANCLSAYQSSSANATFFAIPDPVISDLKQLLEQDMDKISYQAILKVTQHKLTQLDDPQCQSGTKAVLQAISEQFDEVLKNAIQPKAVLSR